MACFSRCSKPLVCRAALSGFAIALLVVAQLGCSKAVTQERKPAVNGTAEVIDCIKPAALERKASCGSDPKSGDLNKERPVADSDEDPSSGTNPMGAERPEDKSGASPAGVSGVGEKGTADSDQVKEILNNLLSDFGDRMSPDEAAVLAQMLAAEKASTGSEDVSGAGTASFADETTSGESSPSATSGTPESDIGATVNAGGTVSEMPAEQRSFSGSGTGAVASELEVGAAAGSQAEDLANRLDSPEGDSDDAPPALSPQKVLSGFGFICYTGVQEPQQFFWDFVYTDDDWLHWGYIYIEWEGMDCYSADIF